MVPNSHTHMNDILGQPWKIRTPLSSGHFGGPQGVHITLYMFHHMMHGGAAGSGSIAPRAFMFTSV